MPGFDGAAVVKLRVVLDGAGAIDNLVFDPHPEPSTTPAAGASRWPGDPGVR
jgi:hypothetical protein